jgi:hypothetical protein
MKMISFGMNMRQKYGKNKNPIKIKVFYSQHYLKELKKVKMF